MKVVLRILAIGLLIGAIILPAQAAEFRSSEQSVSVGQNEKPRDLHLAGRNIIIDANTSGDLVLADETILSNGEVENSLFIAGGTVTVRSHVMHHVRIAGGTVTISGKVDGDIYIAGGEVTLADTSEIGGGLYVASGTLTLNGKVNGELRVGSGTVVINGIVGPSKIYADEISLTSKARVNGNFNYHSSKTATIDPAAVVTGQTNYTKYVGSQFDKYGFFFGSFLTLGYLLRLLGAILLGWLLLRFWPRTSRKVADFAFGSPLQAIGYGLLTLIGVILMVMVLFFTIVGTGIASMVFALWLITLMIGSIFGKILLGSWLYRMLKKDAGYQLTTSTVALGVIVSSLLIFLPVVGPFITFIFFLLGVGSVFNLVVHSKETTTTNPTV